jgi:hydrogenase maturation protease
LCSDRPPADVLVLGVGNSLLGDDGVGVHMVGQLSCDGLGPEQDVELLEGGTQGLALLGSLAGRTALILLDAVSLGDAPGSVHVRRNEDVLALGYRSSTAHEGNAGELLAAARLLGDLPPNLFLVGVEPASLEGGIGLSEPVRQALPIALAAARRLVEEALHQVRTNGLCPHAGDDPCDRVIEILR